MHQILSLYHRKNFIVKMSLISRFCSPNTGSLLKPPKARGLFLASPLFSLSKREGAENLIAEVHPNRQWNASISCTGLRMRRIQCRGH